MRVAIVVVTRTGADFIAGLVESLELGLAAVNWWVRAQHNWPQLER